ncbi:hypothetical protein HYW87_00895 [Candidatus Roizmanbacteria bacterium]|nr:hypothetical protein [Candidatus Roizmanbacteria bacterium]
MKKRFLAIFLALFLIVLPGFYSVRSQSISVNQEKVVYTLPYPGILPDHPLYAVKIIRDRILDVMTRDTMKKAQLYLLLSDKRAAMVPFLIQKGKDKLAVGTLDEGEKYFSQIPRLVETSKKQGVSPTADLVHKLKLANVKHREIVETLLKEVPQGQNQEINRILQVNQQIKKDLQKY